MFLVLFLVFFWDIGGAWRLHLLSRWDVIDEPWELDPRSWILGLEQHYHHFYLLIFRCFFSLSRHRRPCAVIRGRMGGS